MLLPGHPGVVSWYEQYFWTPADICDPYTQTILGTPLVFETSLKCGKIQCKSTFNKKKLCLLMIEHIETNQRVLYLPEDI